MLNKEELIKYAAFVLNNFATPEDLSLVAISSSDNITDHKEPMIILDINYPKILVPSRVRTLIQIEAKSDKKTKQLVRYLFNSVFTDLNYWLENNATQFLEKHAEMFAAFNCDYLLDCRISV